MAIQAANNRMTHGEGFAREAAAHMRQLNGTARYIGILDGTDEESLPDEMQKPIHLFNLVRPVGPHSVGATLTLDDLLAAVPLTFELDTLKPGDIV